MTPDDALKVAREWLQSAAVDGDALGLSPIDYETGLAELLTRERAAAVEAAKPTPVVDVVWLERRAMMEILRWVLDEALCKRELIESELARLQAGQKRERDATS